MTHTKGKWFTVELDGEIDIASQLTETMQSPSIATVLPVSGVLNKIGGGSTQANANLIAEAPKMLAELKMVAIGLKHIDTAWARERVGYVEDVITKAEGTS